MNKKFRIAIMLVIVLVTASLTMGGYEDAKKGKAVSKEDLYKQVELFGDAVSVIRADYVEEIDSKKLIYGALKGMLSSLDDFSQFMDPDEYKEIRVETKGEFGGIGVEISMKEGILTIIAPIGGTPAEAAGIRAGDKIVKINGKITKNMSLNDAVKEMRGDPGTAVALTIWRESEEKVLDFSIKRAIIKVHSIKKASLIEDKIGYIRLVEFQEKAAVELEEALKKLESEGMDSLILDLRNNPGGLLDIAIDISEKFLPKDKVIVSTKSRAPGQNMVFKSQGRFSHPDYPLIVLVNGGSASASEIVAGAIQDNKRGIVLGTKTFGKGSVQTVIPLKDDSALRLTTAAYFTPSGKSIMKQGVIPDVVVEREEYPEKKKEEATAIFEKVENEGKPKDTKKEKEGKGIKDEIVRDNQLERAIDLMKAIKVYKGQEKKVS